MPTLAELTERLTLYRTAEARILDGGQSYATSSGTGERSATRANLGQVQAMIRQLEEKYKDKGRLVIRASGTEPRVRVMIEGPDQREMDRDVYTLSKLIEKELN